MTLNHRISHVMFPWLNGLTRNNLKKYLFYRSTPVGEKVHPSRKGVAWPQKQESVWARFICSQETENREQETGQGYIHPSPPLKAHTQWYNSSSKALPPKSSRTFSNSTTNWGPSECSNAQACSHLTQTTPGSNTVHPFRDWTEPLPVLSLWPKPDTDYPLAGNQ